jgi:hypothetical protein
MNRDLFAYETEGENGVGATGVTFTIGADGKATTVVPREAAVEFEACTVSGARSRVPQGRFCASHYLNSDLRPHHPYFGSYFARMVTSAPALTRTRGSGDCQYTVSPMFI